MQPYLEAAQKVVERCQWLSQFTEEPGRTTRTFLSAPMREVHEYLRIWMESFGMAVRLDEAGNQRGTIGEGTRWIIGSHLDTVPNAGAYDGILGVVLGIALAEQISRLGLRFQLEVIGFSEEEGVRFGVPFIGSRALIGDAAALLDLRDASGVSVAEAIAWYGLDPNGIAGVQTEAAGYLEFHIEQGPVLESLGLPLGVVEAIVGQSRLDLTFTGAANHAGTTPMALRRDALAGAAEWIGRVEAEALSKPDLVATVGHIDAAPNVRNAINGTVVVSLDVRHADDGIRLGAVASLLAEAEAIGGRRKLTVGHRVKLDQEAVVMSASLTATLEEHRMTSGAGHDAMIVAKQMPAAMLFLRSPGGISHHPDESVLVTDVAAAMEVGMRLLRAWEEGHV